MNCQEITTNLNIMKAKYAEFLLKLENNDVAAALEIRKVLIEMMKILKRETNSAVPDPSHEGEIYLNQEINVVRALLKSNRYSVTTGDIWNDEHINFSGTILEPIYEEDKWGDPVRTGGSLSVPNNLPDKETGANCAISFAQIRNLEVKDFRSLPKLPHLKIFNIYDCKIISPEVNAKMDNLENMNFKNCVINDFKFLLEIEMPKMQHINFTNISPPENINISEWENNRDQVFNKLREKNIFVFVT